jgi:hypothetical protein
MSGKNGMNRLNEYSRIMEEVNNNPNIKSAMETFQIDQFEYSRAILATTTIDLISSNTANLGGKHNASMDRDNKRNF